MELLKNEESRKTREETIKRKNQKTNAEDIKRYGNEEQYLPTVINILKFSVRSDRLRDIEYVDKFTYLVSTISSQGSFLAELKKRIYMRRARCLS